MSRLSEQDFLRLWASEPRTIPIEVSFVHARHESHFDLLAYNEERQSRHPEYGPSLGMFQMRQVNWQDVGPWTESDMCQDDFALWQMREYDRHAGSLFTGVANIHDFFYHYNGIGWAAEAYAEALTTEYELYIGNASPTPPDSGGAGALPLIAGVVVITALVLF